MVRVLSCPFKRVQASDDIHFVKHIAKLLSVVGQCLQAGIPVAVQCRAAVVRTSLAFEHSRSCRHHACKCLGQIWGRISACDLVCSCLKTLLIGLHQGTPQYHTWIRKHTAGEHAIALYRIALSPFYSSGNDLEDRYIHAFSFSKAYTALLLQWC